MNKPINKQRRSKSYGSNIAFIDLLFNTLIGFIFLFVIAFILINPIAKKADIELKAEFFITLSWDSKTDDDIDLWVKAPNQEPVGYSNRSDGLVSLDFDDLGAEKVSGTQSVLYTNINEEHVTIRGIIPGEYIVNIHVYNKKNNGPTEVTVKLEDINPFNIIAKRTVTVSRQKEEITMFRFVVDNEGNVTSINELSAKLFPNRSSDN